MIKWFLHDLRKLGKIAFLIVRDHTGLTQCILDEAEQIEWFAGLQTGTTLQVIGTTVKANNKFGVELNQCQITILNPCHHVNPVDITKEEINVELDTLLENRAITLRHPKRTTVFKIASNLEKNIRSFFDTHHFTQINTPKIIAFPTEWGSEVFGFQYFEKQAYMAQSPQFYKQMMIPVFERVYEIGRAYRAEKSSTSRHMTEILMLDMEMWFIDSFEDVIQMTQSFFKTIIDKTWSDCQWAFTFLGQTQPCLIDQFPRISVQDLHELMFVETGEDYRWELDLVPVEERWICDYSAQNRWSDAVFVTDFPRSDAKFYHHQNPDNSASTDRADLLFRWVELATLTRRQVNYDTLMSQIKSKDINPDQPGLKYYLDAFKYGMPESGGFGFGMARCIQKLCGLANAKEAELFPRDTVRLTP
jgi:nondiscriminating aspartyl-tRNA synthetase